MPKFLTSCHYNKEEISRHLEKSIGYWPVQMNGNKFGTGEILRKPVEVVKGRILAGWAQKSPESRCALHPILFFPASIGLDKLIHSLCSPLIINLSTIANSLQLENGIFCLIHLLRYCEGSESIPRYLMTTSEQRKLLHLCGVSTLTNYSGDNLCDFGLEL